MNPIIIRKNFLVVAFLFIVLCGKSQTANFNVLYVDNIYPLDTPFIYCPVYDSLKIVPPKDMINTKWLIESSIIFSDTIQTDTLRLQKDYNGHFYCQGMVNTEFKQYHFVIRPFRVNAGNDLVVKCNTSYQLSVNSNAQNEDGYSYSWWPLKGLNDSTLKSPTLSGITKECTYFVSVKNADGCLAKDSIKLQVKANDAPAICMVGVNSSNKNEIRISNYFSGFVDSFYIYRETFVTNQYKKIGTIVSNVKTFVDSVSNPHIISNKYKISAKDACGFETGFSIPHKTMHLSINQGQNNVWNLIWENYEGVVVPTYLIYRGTSVSNLQLIGSSPASNTQYSDFSAPSGFVYYQIEVVNPNNCDALSSSKHIKSTSEYYSIRSNLATNNPSSAFGEKWEDDGIEIYPNPSKKEIFVSINDFNISGVIELLDITGNKLDEKIIETNTTRITLDKIPIGIYIVKISTSRGVKLKKVVKSN